MTSSEPLPTVLDTNIVLDLWIFDDPRTQSLRQALAQGHWHWIATAAMREELRRVLGYDHLAQRLQAQQRTAEDVMQAFDQQGLAASAQKLALDATLTGNGKEQVTLRCGALSAA
mgnify:CR=1 FL=1